MILIILLNNVAIITMQCTILFCTCDSYPDKGDRLVVILVTDSGTVAVEMVLLLCLILR
eukprot:m.14441 g.14441  ORF g.14441 m.14441 type:complete len:59 (+) comp4313_c0_seq1:158-334(+)